MKRNIVGMLVIACVIVGAAATALALEPAESISRKFRQRITVDSELSRASTQLVNAIIRYDALLEATDHAKSHGNPEPWHDDNNSNDDAIRPVDRALEKLDAALNEFLDAVESDFDLLSLADQNYVRAYMNDMAVVLDDLDGRALRILGRTSDESTRDRFILIIDDLNTDV